MKNMTPENMAQVTGGKLLGPASLFQKEITDVVTDSRKISSGCLFAAIRGERVDGHSFIKKTIGLGAGAVLAEYLPDDVTADIPVILVGSTQKALRELAAFYLDQMQIPTVGIIGSAGKTSTKEMVASVLSQKFRVLKTDGNFNNELGVPLTVFRIREEHQIAVIEMGINHFGEMSRLAAIVRPDTVVMTNIGTAHLEFLKDRDGILKAKSEVFDHIRPESCVILNGDDDKLITLQEVRGRKPLFFGVENTGADIRAVSIEEKGIQNTHCRILTPKSAFAVDIPLSGMHAVHNALAGAAVGYRYGLSDEEIARGIAAYESLSGRFRVTEAGGITIIDDTYNANPSSMKASVSVLAKADERKIAVLGDMKELGENENELHRDVGRFAGEADIDAVYCIGGLGKYIAEGVKETAGEKNRPLAAWFADKEAFISGLSGYVRKGDTVLVKASRSMAFEKIVEALTSLS